MRFRNIFSLHYKSVLHFSSILVPWDLSTFCLQRSAVTFWLSLLFFRLFGIINTWLLIGSPGSILNVVDSGCITNVQIIPGILFFVQYSEISSSIVERAKKGKTFKSLFWISVLWSVILETCMEVTESIVVVYSGEFLCLESFKNRDSVHCTLLVGILIRTQLNIIWIHRVCHAGSTTLYVVAMSSPIMGNQLERKGGSLSSAQVLEFEISKGLYRILASVTMLTHSVLGSLTFPLQDSDLGGN